MPGASRSNALHYIRVGIRTRCARHQNKAWKALEQIEPPLIPLIPSNPFAPFDRLRDRFNRLRDRRWVKRIIFYKVVENNCQNNLVVSEISCTFAPTNLKLRVRVKAAVQHWPSELDTLHSPCTSLAVCGSRWPDVVRSKKNLIRWKRKGDFESKV